MKKVFVTGGASYNSVITLDEFPKAIPQTIHHCEFDETIGNTGAGKALTLSTIGFEVLFHSLLGDDSFGEKVKAQLQVPNLNFISDIDPQGTERHLNIMNSKGERISIFMNPSSDNPEIDYSKFDKPIEAADFVVLNISNYSRNLIENCKRIGKSIWTDLHDYDGQSLYHNDFIDAATYIFLSSDNLPDYRSFMISQIEKGKELVVCTHGKNGATTLTSDFEWIEVPILPNYKLTNANGAGDAFFSGFIYGYSQNYSVYKCLQFATITAGLTIESTSISSQQLTAQFLESTFAQVY